MWVVPSCHKLHLHHLCLCPLTPPFPVSCQFFPLQLDLGQLSLCFHCLPLHFGFNNIKFLLPCDFLCLCDLSKIIFSLLLQLVLWCFCCGIPAEGWPYHHLQKPFAFVTVSCGHLCQI